MNTTLNLLGDEETTSRLRKLAFTGTGHAKKMASYEARFFLVLSRHPHFEPLTQVINDPDIPSMKTRRFYTLLRATMNPSKKLVLNFALLCYSQSLVKLEYIGKDLSDPKTFAMAQYQPNSLVTYFKVLFSVFKGNQIHYRLMRDFNGPGDFQAYWKHTMGATALHRPLDYGRKPNAAVADMDQSHKVRAQLEDGRLDPYNNYLDMTMVLANYLLTTFVLRGGKEVSTSERSNTLVCIYIHILQLTILCFYFPFCTAGSFGKHRFYSWSDGGRRIQRRTLRRHQGHQFRKRFSHLAATSGPRTYRRSVPSHPRRCG
jgi:hypothetical protein